MSSPNDDNRQSDSIEASNQQRGPECWKGVIDRAPDRHATGSADRRDTVAQHQVAAARLLEAAAEAIMHGDPEGCLREMHSARAALDDAVALDREGGQ